MHQQRASHATRGGWQATGLKAAGCAAPTAFCITPRHSGTPGARGSTTSGARQHAPGRAAAAPGAVARQWQQNGACVGTRWVGMRGAVTRPAHSFCGTRWGRHPACSRLCLCTAIPPLCAQQQCDALHNSMFWLHDWSTYIPRCRSRQNPLPAVDTCGDE